MVEHASDRFGDPGIVFNRPETAQMIGFRWSTIAISAVANAEVQFSFEKRPKVGLKKSSTYPLLMPNRSSSFLRSRGVKVDTDPALRVTPAREPAEFRH